MYVVDPDQEVAAVVGGIDVIGPGSADEDVAAAAARGVLDLDLRVSERNLFGGRVVLPPPPPRFTAVTSIQVL